jgi:hypothetical protein
MVNMTNTRKAVFLISAIFFAIATVTLLALGITATTSIAYGFTALAIVMFFCGKMHMISHPKTYPWFAAFPATIWRYFVTQLALSAVFVLREVFSASAFPVGVFFVAHMVLFAFFAVLLIVLNSGREIIEQKDEQVKQSTSQLRLMQADLESLMRKNLEHETPLRRVIEAIKYSDPMSHPTLGLYDEQIQRSIIEMNGLHGNDTANIPQICEKLLAQIADRNSRVKLMK